MIVKTAIIGLALVLGSASAFADKDLSTPEDGTSWDCASDAKVNINYGDASFTLTGTCEEVNLNGSNVKITADGVDTLNVNGAKSTVKTNVLGAVNINGAGNKVTYKKAKSGKKPKTAIMGKGNAVTKVK